MKKTIFFCVGHYLSRNDMQLKFNINVIFRLKINVNRLLLWKTGNTIFFWFEHDIQPKYDALHDFADKIKHRKQLWMSKNRQNLSRFKFCYVCVQKWNFWKKIHANVISLSMLPIQAAKHNDRCIFECTQKTPTGPIHFCHSLMNLCEAIWY